jgi:hypothetical protein
MRWNMMIPARNCRNLGQASAMETPLNLLLRKVGLKLKYRYWEVDLV